MNKTEFYVADRMPTHFGYDLHIVQTKGEKTFVAKAVEFEEQEPQTYCTTGPAATVDREEMQGLFNALWHAGFRPQRLEDSAAALDAVKYHLEDMRKLVFATNDQK